MKLMPAVLLIAGALGGFETPAAASTIEFEHDGGGFAFIGTDGLALEVETEVSPFAFLRLEAGPPTHVGIAAALTVYSFDTGLLTLFDVPAEPKIVARLEPFSIAIFEGRERVWTSAPGLVGQMEIDIRVPLVEGTIDRATARAWRVAPEILGGSIDFVIDDFEGDASTAFRRALPNFVAGEIEVRDVPEPSLTLLSIVAAVILRRRRPPGRRT